MDEQINLGPGGYGGGGGGYGPPPGGGGYGPPPGAGGGDGYGAPPPGGFGGGAPFGPPGGGPQMPGGYGPGGPGFAPAGATSGLAVGALVTGILAIPTTCCCSIGSLPLGIAACVLGGIAMSKIKADPQRYGGKGMALAGLICGGISILLAIVLLVLGMGQALIDQYQHH